jgi:ankyrin repeat protein
VYASWEDTIKRRDIDAIRELLSRGADIDARDRYGQTGLMIAAHSGDLEIVATLIENGASLNVTAKFGLSALMLAIVAGHTETARLLIRAGAELSLRGTGPSGFADKTARDLAALREMGELLGELGADG